MARITRFFGVLTFGVWAAACSSTSTAPSGGDPGAATESIVQIVLRDDGEFDVLQAAVVRAGLVDALSGPSQFTVFAPTDQAFVTTLGAADEAAAIAAVNGLPLDTLRSILLYHVTAGRLDSAFVLASSSYPMQNGRVLSRETLTAAGILSTDIAASNGIIHVIGAVLIP